MTDSIYFACSHFIDYLPVRRVKLGEEASGRRRDALSLREQLNLPKGERCIQIMGRIRGSSSKALARQQFAAQ